MEAYETLSEAITALQEQGYSEDFNIHDNILRSSNGKHQLEHTEFVIDKSFRFDVNEDPSDQAMLYAISSAGRDVKGLLVNGYGIYSEDSSNELLEKLKNGELK
jgi:predicted signal transduction protein with EAL and GGDEF domain